MIAPVRSRIVVRIVAIGLVAALSMALATPAFAALEDDALYTSSTNPGIGPNATWRWGWGNSMRPDLQVTQVPSDDSIDTLRQTNGFIYEFNQVGPSGTPTVTPVWGLSSLTARTGAGTLINGSYDVLAVNSRNGWVAHPGATKTGEGLYSLQLLYYNQSRVESAAAVDGLRFGIDLTAPAAVEGLTSSVGFLPSANGWTESRWRDLRWTPKAYDQLSGVGGFAVSVNASEVAFLHNVAPDPVLEPYAAAIGGRHNLDQLHNATIEDLPAGANTLRVTTVDRATNRSTAAVVMANVDYDTPTIAITNPTSGKSVPRIAQFTVNAKDAAGIAVVHYYVDNILVGSRSAAPYAMTADLSGFANGTHTLKVVTKDMIGDAAGSWNVPHTATASVSFKLDKKAPVISNVTGGPTPFFPRLREGYKDNHIARFTASEGGTASITIKDSRGRVWRKISKKVSAGRNSFTWNGKSDSGAVKSGGFTWSIAMKDAAGNRAATGSRTSTIKFFEVVKVGASRVRIVTR